MSDVAKNKKEQAEIERPSFDIVFQMGVIKMAMQDDYFCSQLVKYLAEDNDLDQYTIFDNEGLQVVFKIIVDSMQTFKNRPTEGQVRQKFNEFDEQERMDYNDLLDNILQQDTHNEEYYRKYLQTYIQQVKMAKGFKKTKKIWKEHPESAPEYMQVVIDSIRRVSFDKEDVVTLKDLPALINEGSTLNSRKIPTGIKELDIDLVGGLPRENLTVVLAGTNVGKSLFCISLGCNALKAVDENGQDRGMKVLHINLEGQRDEAAKRYAANLAQIGYGDLIKGSFDEAAKKRLEEVILRFDENRLKIRNMLGFGATIEDLIVYLKEEYKNFRFDVLVVDYGQLLDSKAKSEGYRFTMSRVFRGLDSISKEFSCVVVTPAQSTRNAQENQNAGGKKWGQAQPESAHILRSTDISEAFEIARVSGVIITLNRTEEEERTNRLRVYLEKQRQGAKNKLYGLITNYSQSNLITGKTYNPFEVVIQGEVDVKMDKKGNSTGSLKDIRPVTEKKMSQVLSAKESKEEIEPDGPIKFIDNLTTEFHALKDDFSRMKAIYDETREQDDYDVEEVDKYSNNLVAIKGRMNELLKEARLMIGQAYPDANKDQYDLIKKQLDDMRKSNGDEKTIKQLERIMRHYEVGLNLVRVPS